jgi:hypothetical protein
MSQFRWFLHVSLVLSWFLLAGSGQAQSLVWSNSLAEARASAKSQGKLILLLAGQATCDTCELMKTGICETPTVRAVIDEIYVPWFSDMDVSAEFLPYESGLGGYTLPLICMIDPATTNAWLWRLTGPYAASTFAGYLRLAASLYPPQPSNLTTGQTVHQSSYQVLGRIWTNTSPTEVWYQVNTDATSNPWVKANGSTNWTAALAPYLVPGGANRYTFGLFARFRSGYTSATNRVTFVYDDTIPPVKAVIGSIQAREGMLSLTITNLTPGATNRLERAQQLGPTNAWTALLTFVSAGTSTNWAEPWSNAGERAFYRIVCQP